MRTKGLFLFFLIAGLCLIVDPVHAELRYSGSSTIGDDLLPDLADAFADKTGVRFTVIDVPGTGKGVRALLAGEADLAGASRMLTDGEKGQGVYYAIIGYDAIGVYVHEENPVRALSAEQIARIFTGKISNWKQVGGRDAPIVCITETWGEKRATMVVFQKMVLHGQPYREDRVEVDKPEHQSGALVKEKNGIISVSKVFARQGIRPLPVDGIEPTAENILAGSYPITRPLIFLARGYPQGEIARFFQFLATREAQDVIKRYAVSIVP